jgi:uncharacterized protein
MNRQLLVLLFAGILFGAGLAISGMTDPSRVIGFLDVAGAWDYSLALVMGGAVGTMGIGMLIIRQRTQGRGWFGTTLPSCDRSPINRPLVIGALFFGIGWGLSGFCPGPAIVNLGSLHREALIFVPMMALGMVLARSLFKVDRE